ncbi:MAG: biliverdin-producing heme oxygenase [Rothia sp. (in: high G+C Gram-positive bacteria)]|uniref:biliverdin-producing heme oxygenase n=1 Tax=Rothia sp. (in: high G+C Gram-positive bacteria) TaxID=1885016 RepID=UPI0026E0290C|nr:biliverdin-producing heme oxygenase [Rothia sp. (in: high G+C Gram-positive bacteria)]MDO5750538.1 biliverdin-producing heme oxygenase [Rothia sp. (in: high G+C Gram-positive bacteria)]
MTIAPEAPAEERFSAQLKAGTKQVHDNAEHSTFMEDLMGGKLNTAAYLRLINQYVYIYEALEGLTAKFCAEDNEITRPFTIEGLDRGAAIRSDIKALGQEEIDPILPSTQAYVDAILATENAPERYLAHHYLRYLGDLSGGQAVAALVARHYGIEKDALSMYRFPELPKPKIFKDGYRELLDNAPLSAEQRQALVAEAIEGFRLNAALFAELGRETAA